MTIEGIEYAKSLVETLPGQRLRPTMFLADQLQMVGLPLEFRFIVVGDEDLTGLPSGLYAEIGLERAAYTESSETQSAIHTDLSLALGKIEVKDLLKDGAHFHGLRGILYTPVMEAPEGQLVLQIDPE